MLLCYQNFDIPTPEGGRYVCVEQRLREKAATQGKAFNSTLTGPVTGLNAGGHAHFEARPDDGAKNQPLPSGSFKACFRLLDDRISFKRSLQNRLQCDPTGWIRQASHRNREKEFWRYELSQAPQAACWG